MERLRFAIFGAGFWSRYQLAAWGETGAVQCVAVYNRTREKADGLARLAGGAAVYTDPQELLSCERLDFIDIITNCETHPAMVELAAKAGLPVICQKPMAPSFAEARHMVDSCRRAGIPFYVHENFRWQAPVRALKHALSGEGIGRPFRARIRMVSGFPVFDNQPFLRELERFLLVDIGSHILDLVRFLFGEAETLYCQTQRVQRAIRGEDVATVILKMISGVTVICEMGYAGNALYPEIFPQTLALIEAEAGSVELAPDYWIRSVTHQGVNAVRSQPVHYGWADPAYDVAHASMVPCLCDLLAGLRGERAPETTAEDNLKTMQLVYAAYDSAERNEVIRL